MPPSGRKGKTRARRAPTSTETHNHEQSDAEPEALATPSRASRKRARGSDVAVTSSRNTRRKTKDTRTNDAQDTEGTEQQEVSDNETEPSEPTEEEIIQSLKVADKKVHATQDFANELLDGQESVPGYGKIAGRDWVYIIRKIEVNIGRPEEHVRLEPDGERGQHPATPSAKTVVDIDLGPDRQVSRLHAVIAYDSEYARWYAMVNGRNGLRVDNNLHKRGTKTYLRNGSVIEINNTQMAFITTPVAGNELPVWDASIIKQAQKSSEEDDDGEDDPRSTANPRYVHNGRTGLQDTGMYQSEHNGQQHSQSSHGQPQQRMHPHSQRALQVTPGTPMRSQPAFPKSSPAANYSRGVMMESTEGIDYSAETARDLKPPYSYAQLIGMAILGTEEQQMTLNNIYKWVMSNYAFYRHNTAGWQNSIRHNLSLNKAFTKIPRRTDEPGKGMKWMIAPDEFDNFVQQGMKGCRRPNAIPGTQSTMNSPNSPMDRVKGVMKRDGELTPPLNSYRPPYQTATEAYTPERGPRRPANGQLDSSVGLGIGGSTLVDYDYPSRATPRNGLNAIAHAAGSPPALYVNDEGRVGPLDTPFPLRPSQRLAPPSTLRRPSDFIQFSSPAPFWKMEGLIGSTPYKFDLSPVKTPFPALKKANGEVEAKQEDQSSPPIARESASEPSKDNGEISKRSGSPVIGSSSPPMRNAMSAALDASPTASRPATAVAKALSQLSQSAPGQQQQGHEAPNSTPPGVNGLHKASEAQQQHTPPTTASASSQPVARPRELPQTSVASNFDVAHNGHSSNGAMVNGTTYSNPYSSSAPQSNGYHHPPSSSSAVVAAVVDDGDDEGIDLVKGFQPIGAFHQRNHLAMTLGMAGGPAAPGFGR
ncbi:unnamed protein product [Zymoseptoria tritici ST99CH_1A5]|uniref:Fork-head domain-containing protein n=1 Tax=Zymoseptoria tritici ST99CH_1A5 TaxID=1276529 RepID=A0A1Y6LJC0_ZYMTR|nr:unnamed protein product [Zymoseptoria tritici ST99CH_1A5]